MPTPSQDRFLAAVDTLATGYADLSDDAFDDALATLSAAPQPLHDRERGRWLVTRFDEAHRTLTNHDLTNDLSLARQSSRSGLLARRLTPSKPSMLFVGEPTHSTFRTALAPFFSPRALAAILTDAGMDARTRMHAAADASQVRLGHDVVHPMCFRATLRSLTLPHPRMDEAAFIDDLFRINTLFNLDLTPEDVAVAQAASARVRGYVEAALPTTPLGGRLHDAGISIDEAVPTIEFMLRSGVVTTGSLLLGAVRESATAARPCPASELLVRHSPTTDTGRVTAAPLVVGDVMIPSGQTVMVVIAAANRDRRRLDVGRDRHLVFGGGAHRCLGVHLVQGQLGALLTLLKQRPVTSGGFWSAVPHRTPTFRGLRELIVA